MPIQHHWDNQGQTTYCLSCDGDWAWSDFRDALKPAFKAITLVEHQVDFIIWFKSRLPKGNTIQSFRRAGTDQPPNIYRTVIVATDLSFVEKLARFINQMEGWKGPDFFHDIDEARNWLTEQQANSLDSL